MEHSKVRDLLDQHTPIMVTVKGATMGLTAGTVTGAIVATLFDRDVPPVNKNVTHPELMRTLKVCGNYGLTFAALGGIYAGVDQLLEKQRKKKDFINGAVGAFVAGASVLGFKGRSISSALFCGSALAFTSAVLEHCLSDDKTHDQ
ncbi:outer envelope pore protein 16-3, chloroplastic/mitochondrial-like isoform X1 [Phoenix dactylifera]|uniref:Outer envelope pore protein 16-3, chloroplastic/mitochondrial-like isoform X1 n=1 Tax=Phoenix dactylifera TaxID=42345 RepID=A0A8B7BXC5_PHODC|nr:outer envelope pore protein 16-3, chloroplastic/mitochondrial-like isoform X1 [Phoenix dactylifera]